MIFSVSAQIKEENYDLNKKIHNHPCVLFSGASLNAYKGVRIVHT